MDRAGGCARSVLSAEKAQRRHIKRFVLLMNGGTQKDRELAIAEPLKPAV